MLTLVKWTTAVLFYSGLSLFGVGVLSCILLLYVGVYMMAGGVRYDSDTFLYRPQIRQLQLEDHRSEILPVEPRSHRLFK